MPNKYQENHFESLCKQWRSKGLDELIKQVKLMIGRFNCEERVLAVNSATKFGYPLTNRAYR